MPFTRPSDEDILKYEQSIMQEQVNCAPLVSPALPLQQIVKEYSTGDNERYVLKLANLESLYTQIRRCRRDGNCFYRAFAFELICALGRLEEAKVGNVITLITHYLDKGGFMRNTFEDFLEAFVESVKASAGSGDQLISEWNNNEYQSQSSVMLLRLLTSSYLQSNAEEYNAFITEDFDVKSNELSLMQLYCQRMVECMGIESDQIHIVALCNALRCKVRVIYVDGSDDFGMNPLEFGDDSVCDAINCAIPFPLFTVTMLYRPGHYDLLY